MKGSCIGCSWSIEGQCESGQSVGLDKTKLEHPKEQLVEDCRGFLQALRNNSLEGLRDC